MGHHLYDMGLDDDLEAFDDRQIQERLDALRFNLEITEGHHIAVQKMLGEIEEPFTVEEQKLVDMGYTYDEERGWYNIYLPHIALKELQKVYPEHIQFIKSLLQAVVSVSYKRKTTKLSISLPSLACEENAGSANTPTLESHHV